MERAKELVVKGGDEGSMGGTEMGTGDLGGGGMSSRRSCVVGVLPVTAVNWALVDIYGWDCDGAERVVSSEES